jgi:hypothetical protein
MPEPEMLIGAKLRFRRRWTGLLVAGSGLLVMYFTLIGAYLRYAYLETRFHILWTVESINYGQTHDTTPEGHVQVFRDTELVTYNPHGRLVAVFDDFPHDDRFSSNFYAPDGYMVYLSTDYDWIDSSYTSHGELALYTPDIEPCWQLPVRLKGMILGLHIGNTLIHLISDHAIYCYSREGDLLWKLDQEQTSSFKQFSSSCIDANGVLYMPNEHQQMWAVDPDGNILFAEDSFSYGNTSPVIGPDGNLYVLTWNDEFVILSPDGQILFQQKLAAMAGSISYVTEPSVAINRHGQIAVLSTTQELHCFTPEWELTGSIDLSSLEYPQRPYYSDAGRIYTGSYSRGVFCYSSSGKKLWQNRYVRMNERACGSDGILYVITRDRLLGMSL